MASSNQYNLTLVLENELFATLEETPKRFNILSNRDRSTQCHKGCTMSHTKGNLIMFWPHINWLKQIEVLTIKHTKSSPYALLYDR